MLQINAIFVYYYAFGDSQNRYILVDFIWKDHHTFDPEKNIRFRIQNEKEHCARAMATQEVSLRIIQDSCFLDNGDYE